MAYVKKGGNGGQRPGAGKKKGYRHQNTLDKIAAREALRLIVMQHMEPMTAAQIASAEGLKYLVTRDKKSGKFIRVAPAMTGNLQEETIEVWEEDPSTAAYIDLKNRALDKPNEQEQELKLTGDADRLALLLAGRERARKGRS